MLNNSCTTLYRPSANLAMIILCNNPTHAPIYVNTTYSHCYTPTCFKQQGAMLKEWGGSTKYVSRCKCQIKQQCVVCCMTVDDCHATSNILILNLTFTSEHSCKFDNCHKTYNMLSSIWYEHLDMYFVDPAHEMYRYSVMMAPWGLKHVGV